MIWVLLQSESPWQRNDAITLFIYLCVSLYQEFFWRNRLREYVPAIIASIMAKFQQILWERFRNILTRSFNNHKNSEIACYLKAFPVFNVLETCREYLLTIDLQIVEFIKKCMERFFEKCEICRHGSNYVQNL